MLKYNKWFETDCIAVGNIASTLASISLKYVRSDIVNNYQPLIDPDVIEISCFRGKILSDYRSRKGRTLKCDLRIISE